MTETTPNAVPPPPPPRRPRRGERLHTVGAAIVAVLVVVAGILLVNLLNAPSPGNDAKASPSPQLRGPSVAPASARSTGGPSSPASSATPSASPLPSASGSSAGAGAGTGSGAAGTGGTSGLVFAPVVVYNNSKITGLAAAAAKKVEAAGFTVTTVSGFRGLLSETTVYYDPGDLPAAQTLMKLVPGIPRAFPRPSWLLDTKTLILIVTRDFPVSAAS